MIVSNGLGLIVDLSIFDQMANIPKAYTPEVEVFSGPGSFWHVVMGAIAAILPAGITAAGSVAFSGYELSKLAAGESPSNAAGSIIEFALGLLAGYLLKRGGSL